VHLANSNDHGLLVGALALNGATLAKQVAALSMMTLRLGKAMGLTSEEVHRLILQANDPAPSAVATVINSIVVSYRAAREGLR
jgi:hypothetical protein